MRLAAQPAPEGRRGDHSVDHCLVIPGRRGEAGLNFRVDRPKRLSEALAIVSRWERAGQERAEVGLPATYFVGHAQGEGHVENLSADGLFLRSPMLPKEGERLVIAFTTPDGRKVAVEGTIRWTIEDTTVPSGFGVRLSSFGDDYLVAVEEFLNAKDRRSASSTGDT